MILDMKNRTRIALAASMTAFLIGGLSGAGLSLRSHPTSSGSTTPSPLVRDRIVHRTRVRTIAVPSTKPASSAGGSPSPTGVATTLASAAEDVNPRIVTPRKVSSRVSPVGGRHAEEEPEHEHEGSDE